MTYRIVMIVLFAGSLLYTQFIDTDINNIRDGIPLFFIIAGGLFSLMDLLRWINPGGDGMWLSSLGWIPHFEEERDIFLASMLMAALFLISYFIFST